MLYTGAMVSRSYQIDGLLDALSDKGAAIVRTRLAIRHAITNNLTDEGLGKLLLRHLETDAEREAAVTSPQSS